MLIQSVLAVAMLSLPVGASEPSCKILNATYIAAGQADYVINFKRLADSTGLVSDLAMHLTSKSGKVDRWFFFDSGSSSQVSLIATTDPMAAGWKKDLDQRGGGGSSATYLQFSSDGLGTDLSPKSFSTAPQFIVIPEIYDAMRRFGEEKYKPSAFVFHDCK